MDEKLYFKKCETEGCDYKTKYTICSRCRTTLKIKVKCAHPDCDKIVKNSYCSDHEIKKNKCNYVYKSGKICSENAFGERCSKHSAKTKEYICEYQKKVKPKTNDDLVKILRKRVENYEKKIKDLEEVTRD